jgi:hypothetical protein
MNLSAAPFLGVLPVPLLAAAQKIPSSPLVAAVTAGVLLLVSQPIIQRMVRIENEPRLLRILRWSLALHLLSAPAQIFVVNHFYHGVADYNQYLHASSAIGNNFRHFSFTIKGSGESLHLIGDGALTIVGGVVMTIVGSNQLAVFLVFAWLSFLGALGFYRAFSITFPDADKHRYALMLFFLPSLLFWTADLSKEAVLTLSLGIASYGGARALQRMPGGFLLIVVGGIIGLFVRPNEVALFLGAFAIAMVFRTRGTGKMRGLRRVGSWIFLVVVVVAAAQLASKQLHLSTKSLGGALGSINKNNGSAASITNSGNVPYSHNPLTYPRDIYEVLFNPLPITARSTTQLVAALENTVVVVLILKSLRNLRAVPRALTTRPYVLVCLLYTLAFFYAFAALGNLGLITRERTVLFPFMLVLMCVPVSPKGEPRRYPWEYPRMTRRRQKKQEARYWSTF